MRGLLTDLMASVVIFALMAGLMTHEPTERDMELRHRHMVIETFEDKLEAAQNRLKKPDRKVPLSRRAIRDINREIRECQQTLEDLADPKMKTAEGAMATE